MFRTNFLLSGDFSAYRWYNKSIEKDFCLFNVYDLSYGRGYVYSLQYHLVWCTNFGKAVLKDGIDVRVKELLEELSEEYQFTILAMEVMPDHIHLLVDCKPQFYLADMMKIMKGKIARRLFLECPDLKKELWGGHLWSDGYAVRTAGVVTSEKIEQYINRV